MYVPVADVPFPKNPKNLMPRVKKELLKQNLTAEENEWRNQEYGVCNGEYQT